jgi:hypothetical protein
MGYFWRKKYFHHIFLIKQLDRSELPANKTNNLNVICDYCDYICILFVVFGFLVLFEAKKQQINNLNFFRVSI